MLPVAPPQVTSKISSYRVFTQYKSITDHLEQDGLQEIPNQHGDSLA
jgi:hypothetical protein